MKEDCFIVDSVSPDGLWVVVFEDDGETGYLYLCAQKNGEFGGIVDYLWVYDQISPSIEECKEVFIIWSDDSSRAGLIIDGEYWGIFDLKTKRKMNAPRNWNCIVPIERKYWDYGLAENNGEALKTLKKNQICNYLRR